MEWDLVSRGSGQTNEANLLTGTNHGQQERGRDSRAMINVEGTHKKGQWGIPSKINNKQQTVCQAPGGGIAARIQAIPPTSAMLPSKENLNGKAGLRTTTTKKLHSLTRH